MAYWNLVSIYTYLHRETSCKLWPVVSLLIGAYLRLILYVDITFITLSDDNFTFFVIHTLDEKQDALYA